MNRKSNHQNLLRRALTLAVVMITMFALPTGAWAQQGTGEGDTGQVGQGGTEISEATYAINGTASPAGGGTVTAYNGSDVITSAKQNTVVTLTATPADGYHFLKWIVTSGDDAVALGDEYSETTSFTIGQRGVSAQAVFVYGNSENCNSYPAEGGWIVRDGTKVFVTVNEADGYYLKSVIRSTEAPTESTEQTTELSNGVSLGEPIAAAGKKPYYYASEGGYISAAFRKPSDDLRVTYNMNGHGTAIATQKLTFNAQGTATVPEPTDPKEEGWVFFGWYKDKNFTQPFDFSTTISKESLKYNKEIDCYPLTLYAKWVLNQFTIDGLKYKITSLNPFTVELTGYEGDELTGVLKIPASVKIGGNDYSVTSISGRAFEYTGLTSLIIPDAITTIGEYAFHACRDLKSVMLGSGVTSIENVFIGCVKLESFTVDENNANYKSLDGVLFNKAGTTLIQYPHAKSESYTVPEGVTTIGNDAFKNNNVLTSIIIGNDVTSIGNSAFEECIYLTSVTIGNSVKSIGGAAFYNCYALKSVIIGNGVTTIGDYAFHACDALTSVIFGNSVTSIGSFAFQACSSLTSVNIPATVTTIDSWAFLACIRLTSVTINATSLTKYGKDAFKTNLFGNASGLKIYVPAGSEDTYKAGWSEYAEVIEAIPEADATKYAITTDDYCEVYDANMWSENTPLSEATAGMKLEISLKEGAQPASGKYFSGEYTVNGVSLGANEWEEFNSGFTMPAQAVTVAALQADRTVLTFDFSTAGPQEMTKAAIQLFNGDERLEGKRIRNEGDDGELIDFDGSGTPDMKRYFDATEDHCYVERLATADYTGSYSLTYEGPSDCYSAITFVFPSQSQQPLPTMDVSVTFTETTYDGKTHALNVSVPDGATITYADKQDGTYSATAPTFKDVVNTTIYYKVTKEGCQDATGTVAVKINKKPLTVTAENKSMTAGGTEPALTYKTDGLVEGDKITVVLQRAEGNTVGTYDITLKTISGVDNYELTFVKGVFTIKQPVINNNDPLGNLNGKELFALLDELKPIINQIAPGLNIALTADANGRLSVTVNGMTFSIGEELILVLRNVKKEDILTPAFQGKVLAYLSKLMNGNAGTRGSGDMVETELVSGEEFVIPDDGDLVLILKTEEAPVTITALTVTSKADDSGDNKDDNKNDINGDGVVNAIDLVKAISAGKTKAEIDAIVNAIMGK